MSSITLAELVDLLRECAGVDESVDLSGDIIDTQFEDLGYDSLALFNTMGRIERDYHIALADDVLATARTPRAFIDTVNSALVRTL